MKNTKLNFNSIVFQLSYAFLGFYGAIIQDFTLTAVSLIGLQISIKEELDL